jgi:hypothetical protein
MHSSTSQSACDQGLSDRVADRCFLIIADLRLLPPESASVDEVSREVEVAAQTLERWLSDALSTPARERAWTAPARLEAVIATAAMDGAARNA